ncbi:5-formyltetrahydrofolate cyclo-ligase [Brachybacterium sp. DNPG3]
MHETDAGAADGPDAGSGSGEDRASVVERKALLRRSLRERRRAIYGGADGAERRRREGIELLARSADLVDGAPGRVIAAFHPTPTEPDALPLWRALSDAGARLIFPVSAGEELDWVAWDGTSAFAPSAGRGFGFEPAGPRLGADALARADLVLAPALAVDRSGTRIGHGGGYYDRAFGHLRPTTPLLVLVHPHEVLAAGEIPRAAHDVPVPEALTAAGRVSLRTP